jgi:uncharacterized protein YdcH (DUF465 family)
MSLAESFLNTAKDLLMMSENIKRMDSRVDRIADDLGGLDRRIMRIEVLIELTGKQTARKGASKELP